ncbi:MAG: hypothetical protein HY556_00435 [Euryarchaeota archaeon]|nr:hypothetical protein [Euryarchaeota archaeon]
MQDAVALFNGVAAVFILLVGLRLAQVLSNNPVSEVIEEVMYIRVRELALSASLFLTVLTMELVEYLPPLVAAIGVADIGTFQGMALYLNGIQAIFLLIATILAFTILSGYSRRHQEDRSRGLLVDLAARKRRPKRRLE